MNDTLNLEKLREIQRKLADIPPPPYLASWTMFPKGKFLKFKYEGQEYWGGHPELWDMVPGTTLDQMSSTVWQVVVHNLDTSETALKRFRDAYAAAMSEALKDHPQTQTASGRWWPASSS